MAEVKLSDLLDEQELARAVEDGYVRRQVHPSQPLAILNYTERATYERAWNEVTRQCRGLIYDPRTGVVVARAYRKFHNYEEHPEGSFSLSAPCAVTDKADGSLGILYRADDGWAIATRGSFASEQALHATRVLRERYPDFEPPSGMTVLFEIIYSANRIVIDYGDMDDLMLLGGVDIASGAVAGPDEVPGWGGPATAVIAAGTLAEVLALPPRENCEGLVVRMADGTMLKLKQADYLALHRILTGTSARTVWEYLTVDACRHLIAKPLHWGSRLGLDPARAAEIIAVGPHWRSRLTDGVPDEFHAWLRETIESLNGHVAQLARDLAEEASSLRAAHGADRKAFAGAAAAHPHSGALFLLLDGKDITTYLWRDAYPAAEKPWGMRSEDVA